LQIAFLNCWEERDSPPAHMFLGCSTQLCTLAWLSLLTLLVSHLLLEHPYWPTCLPAPAFTTQSCFPLPSTNLLPHPLPTFSKLEVSGSTLRKWHTAWTAVPFTQAKRIAQSATIRLTRVGREKGPGGTEDPLGRAWHAFPRFRPGQ
jgi:hypothetical protein